MRLFNYLLSLLFLGLLGSCAIQPPPPQITVEENYKIPDAPESVIKIPIKINLKPYFDATDKEVDKVFRGSEQNCEGVSFKYKFDRSPIEFKGTGTKLTFDVDGQYSLWLNYCAACTDLFASAPYCLSPRIYVTCGVDEPMRKVHVGFTTEIGVSKDYTLQSETTLKTVKALSPCKISVFSYDATSELEKELKTALKEVEKDIDKEISAISLKPEINEAWKILAEPMDLEGYGFLELNPQSIAMGKIKYIGDTAYFNAVLNAQPVILSAKSGKPAKSLPNMYTYKNRDGFDITMDIFTNYDSLTAILTRNLSGMEVDIKGKKIIFGEVSIYGASNKQLHIKVDFSGKKSGTLYFTGTPVFETVGQHISFPDLTFDLETESALLKGAKWLFDKKITSVLREQASMDLKPYLDKLKTELNKNLNMELDKGVFMSGRVKGIDIRFIQPTSDQLHIRVHSLGDLSIRMD
jgi:hypothetical protein